MRRPILLIFTNAMILIVVFALLTQSLVVIQRLAVAQNVVGIVEVQRGGRGDFRALARLDAVKSGDVVRSSGNGVAEFKWADGTRWKIAPNTQIRIKKAISNTLAHSEQNQLELSTGKVFVRILKPLLAESKFEVETPSAVASVRGTIFSVAVLGDRTQVAVFKGAVAVRARAGEAATTVQSGQQVISDGRTVQKRPDEQAQREFSAESTIITPELSVDVSATDAGKALISGQTEAGDVVTINGEAVRILGNGVFRTQRPIPADGRFEIITTDRHDQTNTIIKTLGASATGAAATR